MKCPFCKKNEAYWAYTFVAYLSEYDYDHDVATPFEDYVCGPCVQRYERNLGRSYWSLTQMERRPITTIDYPLIAASKRHYKFLKHIKADPLRAFNHLKELVKKEGQIKEETNNK
jgi:hypothetical protein